MAAQKKEGCLHPDRTSAVGHQQFEPGKIHCHVIQEQRIAKTVAGAGKYGRPGVHHHRNALLLGHAVNSGQLFYAVYIIIGK